MLHAITLLCLIPVSMKKIKLIVTLKNNQNEKENNDVEYILLRNEIVETTEKAEAVSMSEGENLTKVKLRNSQKLFKNFEMILN